MKKCNVIIAGAGPGDEGLLTVKVIEYLKIADVIIYDRLVNERILNYASKDAELIYMGKERDGGGNLQDSINETLYQKALTGKLVLRLKGGDPFLFGRGGEEAEYLIDKGIAFEVVPGVTSAIAVPAYAGIPVTHRDYASELHIFTAHRKVGTEGLDFSEIAKLKGTIVFLMGAGSLGNISKALIAGGMNKDTSIAIIENGTTIKQRKVIGTLDNIEEVAKQEKIESPAIIVIGDVVKLSEKIDWFSTNEEEIGGREVVLTCDINNMAEIKKIFKNAIELPMIKTIQNDFIVPELSNYSAIFFTGVKGVRHFFDRLDDLRVLGKMKIGVVGESTFKEIKKYKIISDFIPDEYTVEAGIDITAINMKMNERLLIVTSSISPINTKALAERYPDKSFDKLEVYNTLTIQYREEEIRSKIGTGKIVLTFLSSSAVDSFFENMGDFTNMRERAIVASIGPVTTKTLERYGVKPEIEAKKYTAQGLFEEIQKYCKEVTNGYKG